MAGDLVSRETNILQTIEALLRCLVRMDSGPKADEILAPYLCPEIVQFMVRRRTTDELENDKIRRLNQKALAFVTGAKAIARTTTKLTREEWQAKHGHRLKKREPVPKEGEQKNVES